MRSGVGLLLPIADDTAQIANLRIAAGAGHADQALGRPVRCFHEIGPIGTTLRAGGEKFGVSDGGLPAHDAGDGAQSRLSRYSWSSAPGCWLPAGKIGKARPAYGPEPTLPH